MDRALVLATLLAGCLAAADGPPAFAPTGSLAIEAVDSAGAHHAVADGATLERGTEIIFVYEAAGADYLYLLQRAGGALAVIHPSSGLAWMATDADRGRVTPADPNARPDDAPITAWNPDSGGDLEFVLVAAPAPRDVAPDAQSVSIETFLLPPPYVAGPAAGPAVVLDRLKVRFEDEDPPEDEPEEPEEDEPQE